MEKKISIFFIKNIDKVTGFCYDLIVRGKEIKDGR